MTHLFISYAHDDLPTARRLYRDLEDAGHRPWLDQIDLLPGDSWSHRISVEIRRCKYFLALLSKRSLAKTGYVQKELKIALEVLDEHPIDRRFLIPIRLEECEPKDWKLRDLHRIDLFPSYEAAVERLLQSLAEGETAPRPLYVDVGIEVPDEISNWDSERLDRYIDEVLWPEARLRAERDWKNVDLPERGRAVSEAAAAKLRDLADRYRFSDACDRYLEASRSRRPSSSTPAADPLDPTRQELARKIRSVSDTLESARWAINFPEADLGPTDFDKITVQFPNLADGEVSRRALLRAAIHYGHDIGRWLDRNRPLAAATFEALRAAVEQSHRRPAYRALTVIESIRDDDVAAARRGRAAETPRQDSSERLQAALEGRLREFFDSDLRREEPDNAKTAISTYDATVRDLRRTRGGQ